MKQITLKLTTQEKELLEDLRLAESKKQGKVLTMTSFIKLRLGLL